MPPNIVTFLLTFPVVAASSAPRGSARTGAARSVFLLSCKQAHTHAATLNVCAARPDLYPESIARSFYKTCGARARAGNAPSVPCVQTVFSCCLPPLQAQAAGAVLGRTQRGSGCTHLGRDATWNILPFSTSGPAWGVNGSSCNVQVGSFSFFNNSAVNY